MQAPTYQEGKESEVDDLLPWVRGVLATTAQRWLNLTQTVPEGLLRLAPAPGTWSSAECLEHLLATEQRVFPVRVGAVLAGEPIVPYDPGQETHEPTQRPSQLAAAFATHRDESLGALARLLPADLERHTSHPEYGTVTLAEILHHWAVHDLMHTVQAERALMQFFIRGSGPWRPDFAEHEVIPR